MLVTGPLSIAKPTRSMMRGHALPISPTPNKPTKGVSNKDFKTAKTTHMAHTVTAVVPGPVQMSDACLQAMATPVMTARGPEFRQVMARLNSGLRYAFNLSPSLPK